MSENAVYDEVGDIRQKHFHMIQNNCYGTKVGNIYDQANTHTQDLNKSGDISAKKECYKVIFAILVITVVLSAAVAGASTYFAVEIAKLKSQTDKLQQPSTHSDPQNLNTSLQMLQELVTSLNDTLPLVQNSTNNSIQTALISFQNFTDRRIQGLESALALIQNSTENRIQNLESASLLHSMLVEQVEVLRNDIDTLLHMDTSCAALPPSSPSGYYWVRASNGSAVRVYCDMTRSCGGVTGGWMRVAHLNMSNSSEQCPSGLTQRHFDNLRTCVRPEELGGCNSINISSIIPYSKVCGSVIAYQYGALDAYRGYYNAIHLRGETLTLEDHFVDGVVLTHGNPRQHIWTFIAARDELVSHNWSGCPCLRPGFANPPPPFIGNNYFCATGSERHFRTDTFYGDDPLWDGDGCSPRNTCCSFNTPP